MTHDPRTVRPPRRSHGYRADWNGGVWSAFMLSAVLLPGILGGCGDDEPNTASTTAGGGTSEGGQGGTGATGGGGSGATGGTGGMTPNACGNGEQGEDEECDDGNLASHDGCSSGCTSEVADWHLVEVEAAPSNRADHTLTYDSVRDQLVTFGGYFMGPLDSTWEFDGVVWTAFSPNTVPTARYDHRAVFVDGGADTTVMYGGVNAGLTGLAETWSFNGTDWGLIDGASPPGARYRHDMAFDGPAATIVMFGGTNAGTPLGDTWEFDVGTTTWTDAAATDPPTARFGHAMAFDSATNKVVLFGGYDGTSALNDTYEYDSSTNTWTAVTSSEIPTARRFHHMAYDDNRGVVVMFGGFDGAAMLHETWEYAGGQWTETTTMSSTPRGGPMTYDSLRRRVVLSDTVEGGPDTETWAYELTSAWPDELCHTDDDADMDGLVACADPDCEGLRCDGGTCVNGSCE